MPRDPVAPLFEEVVASNITAVTEAELEGRLSAVAEALRIEFARLHSLRNQIGAEIAELHKAPPSRGDLEKFFFGFIDKMIGREPHGCKEILSERLARFIKNPFDAEAIKDSWLI